MDYIDTRVNIHYELPLSEIVYDFFEGLTSSKSVSEQGGKVNGVIGLQSTVYSDKNKHFVMQFDLSQN